MRIVKAQPHQVPAVVSLGRRAYEWGTGKTDFDDSVSAGNWIHLVQNGDGVVFFVSDEQDKPIGFICGYKARNIDTGKLTAQMWHWFVEPAAKGLGLQLLREFEKWGSAQGCDRVAIGCNANLWTDKHRKIYARKGYEMEGMNFSKEI